MRGALALIMLCLGVILDKYFFDIAKGMLMIQNKIQNKASQYKATKEDIFT